MNWLKIFFLIFISSTLFSQDEDREFFVDLSLGLGSVNKKTGNESFSEDSKFNKVLESTIVYKQILLSGQYAHGGYKESSFLGNTNPDIDDYLLKNITLGYEFAVFDRIRFQPHLGLGRITFTSANEENNWRREKSEYDAKIMRIKIMTNNNVFNVGLNFDFIFSDKANLRAYSFFVHMRV